MQCLIMAAGKGMRMRPLTLSTPKPLLPVAGKPIVEWTLERLPPQIDEVVFVVGWLREQFIERYEGGAAGRRVKFVVQDDTSPQGTGGAVLAARDILTGKFLALNGDDVYGAADLAHLAGADGLAIAAKPAAASGRFGILLRDSHGNLSGLLEAGEHPAGSLVNVGAYALDEKIFSVPPAVTPSGEYGLPHAVAVLARTQPVRVVEFDEWIPFGNPDDLQKGAGLLGVPRS